MITDTYTLDQVGTYTITVARFAGNRFEMALVAAGLEYRRAGREFAVTVKQQHLPLIITHTTHVV